MYSLWPISKKNKQDRINHLGSNWIGFQGAFSFLYFYKPVSLLFFTTKKYYYFIYNNKDFYKMANLQKKFITSLIGAEYGVSVKLRAIGVGYKLEQNDNNLILKLGFSHDVKYDYLKNLHFKRLNERSSIYVFTFANKQLLLNYLSKLKKYRPVEPYKGKGLRYIKEKVLRKEGKKSNL